MTFDTLLMNIAEGRGERERKRERGREGGEREREGGREGGGRERESNTKI